jgi:hypothetical protein
MSKYLQTSLAEMTHLAEGLCIIIRRRRRRRIRRIEGRKPMTRNDIIIIIIIIIIMHLQRQSKYDPRLNGYTQVGIHKCHS